MSWRYKGGPGSGAFSAIGSHLLDLAEFVCGPIRSVRGAVLQTVIAERPLPARHRGRPRGRGSRRPARASGERGPRHPHGDLYLRATRTLSASRVAHGLANALGFDELFAESGAVTCDPARAGEFGFVDGTPDGVTQGYRQVLVGPAHPYLTGGLPMDLPGVGYGQNDLFAFPGRGPSWSRSPASSGCRPARRSREGLRNVRLLEAVVASAKPGGGDAPIDPPLDGRDRPA